MKNKFIFLLFIIFCFTSSFSQKKISQPNFGHLFKGLPFKMPVLKIPKFPNKDFNITKYGAVGDGQTLNTLAIQKAIDDCNQKGGGRVIIPAGIWLTGPIYLKSNVNLFLENGSLLQFSKDLDIYPIVESNWEGVQQYRAASPINAKNVNNIAITGKGIIDGAGEIWRPVKKYKLTQNDWSALINSGGVVDAKGETWWPSKEAMKTPEYLSSLSKAKQTITYEEAQIRKLYFRPVLLSLVNCKNIWLDGVTLQNSPAWNIHPLLCENIILSNLNVRNPWFSQNGDGLDLESSKNALVYNCKFDVGDDAMCMKSGKNEEGRKRGIPTENVLIKDCVVYHGHGGFTIGSEMSGGVKNIKIDNCNFIGTDIGVRFKSNRERGGVVENIWLSNIYMKDIPTDALSFNTFYGGVSPTEDKSAEEKSLLAKEENVTDATPVFRNIFIKNIFCNGAKDAIVLQGLPEMPLSNIKIENVDIVADRGISIYDSKGIEIKNVKIKSKSPSVKILNSENICLDNFNPIGVYDTYLQLKGKKTKDIIIKGKNSLELKSKSNLDPALNEKTMLIKN